MLTGGTSAVTITPPLGTQLAGTFDHRDAATVADDLTARTLVLDDGATRVALVVCDLVDITAPVVAAARARITDRCGIAGDQVMIACTHTHTGPVTWDLAEEVADRAYLAWLVERIADGVALACSRLLPVRMAHGAADVEGVCFNRRLRMDDGTVAMNWGRDATGVSGPAGPIDPQVTAFLVEDLIGRPVALWASLSLHYVGTDDDLAVSADYYGVFARAVRRTLGDGCVGILANGTSGNVNNLDIHGAVAATGAARCRLVGESTAAAAIQAVLMQPRRERAILGAERIPFAVERRPVAAEDVALAERILASPLGEEPDPAPFRFAPGDPVPRRWVRLFAAEVLKVTRMPQVATTEIQVVRIGDLALVALPGEIFVEFGLAIKAASPFRRTVVVGLANDELGYVPTRAALGEGAYETWTATSAWVAPGTGEAMVEAALAGLRRAHGWAAVAG